MLLRCGLRQRNYRTSFTLVVRGVQVLSVGPGALLVWTRFTQKRWQQDDFLVLWRCAAVFYLRGRLNSEH